VIAPRAAVAMNLRIRWASACGLAGALILGLTGASLAQTPPAAAATTLFQNVRVFDGRGASLSAPTNLLVRGNTGARRPAAGRRRSAGEPRAGRRPAQELPGHHEGWQDLQGHADQVTRLDPDHGDPASTR